MSKREFDRDPWTIGLPVKHRRVAYRDHLGALKTCRVSWRHKLDADEWAVPNYDFSKWLTDAALSCQPFYAEAVAEGREMAKSR